MPSTYCSLYMRISSFQQLDRRPIQNVGIDIENANRPESNHRYCSFDEGFQAIQKTGDRDAINWAIQVGSDYLVRNYAPYQDLIRLCPPVTSYEGEALKIYLTIFFHVFQNDDGEMMEGKLYSCEDKAELTQGKVTLRGLTPLSIFVCPFQPSSPLAIRVRCRTEKATFISKPVTLSWQKIFHLLATDSIALLEPSKLYFRNVGKLESKVVERPFSCWLGPPPPENGKRKVEQYRYFVKTACTHLRHARQALRDAYNALEMVESARGRLGNNGMAKRAIRMICHDNSTLASKISSRGDRIRDTDPYQEFTFRLVEEF